MSQKSPYDLGWKDEHISGNKMTTSRQKLSILSGYLNCVHIKKAKEITIRPKSVAWAKLLKLLLWSRGL